MADEGSSSRSPYRQISSKAEIERENEEKAENARREALGPKKYQEELELRKNTLLKIVKADSVDYTVELMDSLIDDDWTNGLDELPGNIYNVMALDPIGGSAMLAYADDLKCSTVLTLLLGQGHEARALLRRATGRIGFWCIALIQFIGPPMIAWSFLYAYQDRTEDDSEDLTFAQALSEWNNWFHPDGSMKKLLTLIFLICFQVNGLFVQLDEKAAELKISSVLNILHKNSEGSGHVQGTNEFFRRLGIFMNSWVCIWCSIDAYIVCSTSEQIADLLMNSFALTFLYNLDDIGGDMGFVGHDDWPGLHLAWVSKEAKKFAAEIPDLENYEANPWLEKCMDAVTGVLVILSISLPLLLIITPIKGVDSMYGAG